MTQTIKVNTFMGRPPGKLHDTPFQMRASDEFLKSIDKWRAKQAEKPSRAEAIRRLVELGLSTSASTRPLSLKANAKATELAANAIDRKLDPAASPEEQQSRKRRLLKGPKEFRELRRDHPSHKRNR
jgi:hypothetical protein